MVKFPIMCNVRLDVLNPAFDFLEHLHVKLSNHRSILRYVLVVDKAPGVEKHDEYDLDFLFAHSGLQQRHRCTNPQWRYKMVPIQSRNTCINPLLFITLGITFYSILSNFQASSNLLTGLGVKNQVLQYLAFAHAFLWAHKLSTEDCVNLADSTWNTSELFVTTTSNPIHKTANRPF